MISFRDYIDAVKSSLNNMQVTDGQGNKLDMEDGLVQWCEITHQLRQNNNTMYFVGNGASAMMASHMAADASKNGDFRSCAFNDPALITAVSNDISYEECFVIPLKRFCDSGDVLVTISSSGNSPNIIRAIEAAREMEIESITLSGFRSDNRSRKLGALNFYVPADTYGIVEAAHQVLLHCWLDRFMEEIQMIEMKELKGI